jgi:hypothetical protein
MAKKKLDPKAKAKRQKIIAGVGGVLLLGLLAFQIPKTLKMMNQNQNPPTTTSATPTTPAPGSGAPLAPPSLAGSGSPVSSATPSSSGLDEGVAPSPTAGQLVSFSRFTTKDPFAQQLQSSCAVDSTSGPATSASCAAAPSAPAPSPSKRMPTTPTARVVTPSTPSTSSVSFASRTTATISVNGVVGLVKVGAGFPQTQPIFQLVSLTRTSAKITIAGGTLEGGAPTVTLTKGKQLTLMNTADGSRYALKLLATAA